MNKLTLLYAEDDQEAREIYTQGFKYYCQNVLSAKDGKEALGLYHKNNVDILVLDISMPYYTGLEVAQEVRKIDPDIPIIILSAHSDRDKLLTAIPLRLENYLIKPINQNELDAILSSVVDNIQKNRSTKLILNGALTWNGGELRYKDIEIKLTVKEKNLLKVFVQNRNLYLAPEQIRSYCSSDTEKNDIASIRKTISRLNKKVENITNDKTILISNVYGQGYRLT